MTNRSARRRRWLAMLALAVLAAMTVPLVYAWTGVPQETLAAAGRELFEHQWTPHDPLAGEGDGLGPVFNAKSCVECHFQGGVGGGGSNRHNVLAFEVVPNDERREVVSGVVHAFATRDALLESRGRVSQLFPVIPGGVRIISGCSVIVDDFDPVSFAQINTPALFGAGLIDAIPESAIWTNGTARQVKLFSHELAGDFSTTGVGRPRGKFGWKGQFNKLEDFVAAACAVELGLTNPRRSQDLPTYHREDKRAKPDMDRRQLRELVAFVASLPAPREVMPDEAAARHVVLRGKALFTEIGCADCHTPNLGEAVGIYSDLRLYRIEDEQSASYGRVTTEFEMPAGHPKPNEWKTPPLWGVADSAPYFHDGQSPTLEHAILRHAVQGKKSRTKFESLTRTERDAVIAFLGTLRAPSS